VYMAATYASDRTANRPKNRAATEPATDAST
jgi:hypothetical protein